MRDFLTIEIGRIPNIGDNLILAKPFFYLYARYGIVLVSYNRARPVNISLTCIE